MPAPAKGGASIINFGRIVAKRIKNGLYAGRNIQFGNNVSEDGGNKTRRRWNPNSRRKRLYSEILDRMVQLNVTTHALRCVDNAGGLDPYILNTKPQKLMSLKALELRETLLTAKAVKEAQKRAYLEFVATNGKGKGVAYGGKGKSVADGGEGKGEGVGTAESGFAPEVTASQLTLGRMWDSEISDAEK